MEINDREDLILGGHKGRGGNFGDAGGNIRGSRISYLFGCFGRQAEAAYSYSPQIRERVEHFPTELVAD